MTQKLLQMMLRLYDNIYIEEQYHRLKVVAYLVYKNKIVNFGVNSEKTSPMQHYFRMQTHLSSISDFCDKEHAEINCLRSAAIRKIDFSKAELVIVSKRKSGHFRLARPCCTCMKAIKQFGIKRVWYTTNEDTIINEFIWSDQYGKAF